ncbi:MAG TPA: tripartite tricarboxylate transporter substrate binding protein, partial [Burkholderiales bacterium]|nr:tripartite tricarboxylate transporter substrate binding protein [Burkholderiales bacterium]
QARLIAKRFTESMGQPFVVDNRAGASGVIGAELVARAPADGYTLLFGTAQIPVSMLLLKKAPFDFARDLAPISQVSFAAQVLMVHPSVPARSVPELVALAKKNPGKLNAGSSGNGTANHMAIEMLKLAAGINVTHVPYRSGAPSIAALIGGETDFAFSGAVTALPHVRSGKVRGLAVTSTRRISAAPNLPTLDSFYPGYDSANWYALFAPAGTPAAVINKLHAETVSALKAPEIRDFMTGEGAELVGSTPAELGAYLRREIERYGRVIKAANIKGE